MNVHKDKYALSAELIRYRASINFFSNPIGSFSFHPTIPIIGVNVHNNIAPKDVEEEC